MNKQEMLDYLNKSVKNQGSQSDAALIPLLENIIINLGTGGPMNCPTKVSQLENDAGYATTNDVATAIAQAVTTTLNKEV